MSQDAPEGTYEVAASSAGEPLPDRITSASRTRLLSDRRGLSNGFTRPAAPRLCRRAPLDHIRGNRARPYAVRPGRPGSGGRRRAVPCMRDRACVGLSGPKGGSITAGAPPPESKRLSPGSHII